MPPSPLLIAVDIESFTALGIEPHFSAAAVYLNLHPFGCDIHVHLDHFPRCDQLKGLLEKFRILHGSNIFAIWCQESHVLVLRTADGARDERRAAERKRRLPLQRVAKPDQERKGINGGDPRSGEQAVYAGFGRSVALLRVNLGDYTSEGQSISHGNCTRIKKWVQLRETTT